MRADGEAALSDRQVEQKVTALLGQMTLEEKVGQLTPDRGRLFPGMDPAEEPIRKGGARLGPLAQRPEAVQRAPEDRGRGDAAQDPAALRPRRDPRLPHDLPGAAGHGRLVGSRGAREGAGHRGARSARRRPPLDVRPDARHRARRALGPHRRGRGRGSLPGRGHGGGPGARLPGPVPRRARASHRLRQALRRPTAPPTAGATTTRSYVPEGLLRNVYLPPFQAAVKAGVGTFMSAYMDLNDVPASGEPLPAARRAARRVGLQGLRGERRLRGRRTSSSRASRRRRGRRPRARCRAGPRHGHGEQHLRPEPRPGCRGRYGSRWPQIDAAVRPILAIKVRMGLFENPYVDESKVAAGARRAGAPRGRRGAPPSARWCCCATRGGLLPLAKDLATSP